MKVIAAIFLLLVGFLIIQPALSSTNRTYSAKMNSMHMGGMGCKMKCKKAKKDHGSNDCNQCNPFMACAFGNFFEPAIHFEQIIYSPVASTKIFLTDTKIISAYIADCWHPPEIFSS
jgi:hypothetical protein